jgi:hypothetical protein
MSEKPILFNGEMVRAIREGRKTQTRRPVKPQPDPDGLAKLIHGPWVDTSGKHYQCPFGPVGTRLWVRETFKRIGVDCEPLVATGSQLVQYRADGAERDMPLPRAEIFARNIWVPSIHMPRWASRITLEVKRVWVERVQDISAGDAKSEGDIERSGRLEYHNHGAECHKRWFRWLWDSIYAAKGFGWEENPLVWACEFEVVK